MSYYQSGLLSLLLSCSILLLTGCEPQPAKPLPHALIPYKSLSLPDPLSFKTNTQTIDFNQTSPKGHYSIVYFGYAHCPDVCPTALADMSVEYKKIKHPEQVEFYFCSVDPARDTPKILKDYVTYYHPQFNYLSANSQTIDKLAHTLGAAYQLDAPKPNSKDYLVSHTNLVFVLTPDKQHVAAYLPEAKGMHLAEDLNNALTP
jgi:cytochrome oxidase Cu insertion factor (SCO1/SenC/PrrC family)